MRARKTKTRTVRELLFPKTEAAVGTDTTSSNRTRWLYIISSIGLAVAFGGLWYLYKTDARDVRVAIVFAAIGLVSLGAFILELTEPTMIRKANEIDAKAVERRDMESKAFWEKLRLMPGMLPSLHGQRFNVVLITSIVLVGFVTYQLIFHIFR